MDVYEAIMGRRMVGRVQDKLVSKREIEQLVAAALAAPSHHRTQPWRFIVLSGEALDQLGEAMAEGVRDKLGSSPDLAAKVEKERGRPKRAPVIITVIYVPSDHPKAIEVEDRYAVGAAVENLLLAARGLNIAASWKTGQAAEDQAVKGFLGLTEGEEIAGFIYIGYAQEGAKGPSRREQDLNSKTIWRGAIS